jgi:hypothetical protein
VYSDIRMSFLLFDVEFIGKVFKFHLVPFCSFSMLDFDCFDFSYPAKNPVNAEFTEAKRNRQDAKNKCCILLLTGIYFPGKQPRSIFELFQIV